MWWILVLIIYINLIIYIFGYIFRVYDNTEKDPFQENFGFEEKKKIFNYTINDDIVHYLTYLKTCKNYQDLILDPNTQKLGDIFELNFETIHICALLMIIYLFYTFFRSLFEFFYILIILTCRAVFPIPESVITFLFKCLYPFLSILNGFIFILCIYEFYGGGINSYFEFLSCKNVNYDELRKYKKVENLRSDSRKFSILYIIYIASTVFISRILRTNEGN